jgi:hypothetical protein
MDRRHPYAGMTGQQQAAALDQQATATAIQDGQYPHRSYTPDQRTAADLADFTARLNGPQPVPAAPRPKRIRKPKAAPVVKPEVAQVYPDRPQPVKLEIPQGLLDSIDFLRDIYSKDTIAAALEVCK